MDDHIRKLDTKIQSKETDLNALYTKNSKKRLRHYITRN